MPSFNFSSGTVNNATFHHSRLMGVSDVENTVRDVDIFAILHLHIALFPPDGTQTFDL